MSKHNYSQYSNKNYNNQNAPTQKPKESEKAPVVDVTPESKPVEPVKIVQETVKTVTLPATVDGVVVKCAKLNIRENATVNSAIVCVLDVMSEVKVDAKKSGENWLYVYCANGAEGYCMREYIDAHL